MTTPKTTSIPMDNPLLATALAKVVKNKALKTARSSLSVGRHDVDFACRVKGTLTVGADVEYTPTVHIPLLTTIAFFIRRCGITRDYALQALMEAMKEALENETKGAESVAPIIAKDLEVIEEMMEQVKDSLQNLPKKVKSGPVTTKLTVTPVTV